jgi:hypothetical protein
MQMQHMPSASGGVGLDLQEKRQMLAIKHKSQCGWSMWQKLPQSASPHLFPSSVCLLLEGKGRTRQTHSVRPSPSDCRSGRR